MFCGRREAVFPAAPLFASFTKFGQIFGFPTGSQNISPNCAKISQAGGHSLLIIERGKAEPKNVSATVTQSQRLG